MIDLGLGAEPLENLGLLALIVFRDFKVHLSRLQGSFFRITSARHCRLLKNLSPILTLFMLRNDLVPDLLHDVLAELALFGDKFWPESAFLVNAL